MICVCIKTEEEEEEKEMKSVLLFARVLLLLLCTSSSFLAGRGHSPLFGPIFRVGWWLSRDDRHKQDQSNQNPL
jgi:hypothetical protein